MLVIDSYYGRRVPIQVGMRHIKHILDVMTSVELDILNKQWTRGKLSRLLATKVACETKLNKIKGGSI